MSAITKAIYDILAGDAALVALLSTYEGQPAIFTSDPAPEGAELPYIVAASDVVTVPFDTKTTLGRDLQRDVRCYQDAGGSRQDLEAIAERARALLHRQVITPAGYRHLISEAQGPQAAPTSPSAQGLVVTVRLVIEQT